MKKALSSLSLAILFAVSIFSACSQQQLTGVEEEAQEEALLSLDKEFGGYTSSDEAVAFNDTQIITDSDREEMALDTYAADAAVRDVVAFDPSAASVKAYFLRIKWGLLQGDSTATESFDWSGSAQITKGTLTVMTKIHFERNDSLVLPRESRQLLEFTSSTKTHFDGLTLLIIDNDPSNTDESGTFTFNAGGYSKELRYSQLDSIDLLEDADASGNQVSIVGRAKDITPFAGGFLSGRWMKTAADGGSFKGRWINSVGTNSGHLKGIWGINRAGQRVFKGKYISINGEFRGLIAGQWRYNDGATGGSFQGRWVNRARQAVGTIKGHFRTGREGDRRGFFHGRYQVTDRANSEGDGS